MLQDKIKGQCNKWPKSNREMFINILFKDINNNPNLIYIREINLNRIQERRYFNALINPISTNKELEDKYKDKIEVNQEVDYLKDVREAYINLILQIKALQFLSFLLTVYNTLQDATFYLYSIKKGKAIQIYQLLSITYTLYNYITLGRTFLADIIGLGKIR